MRKKLMTLGALMLVVASLCHAKDNRGSYMTGAELVKALEGKKLSEVQDAEMRRLFSASFGKAYILGIADQTEGSLWCPSSAGILPHELSERVYSYLSGLSAVRQKENAAGLVGEALRQAFPCKRVSARN